MVAVQVVTHAGKNDYSRVRVEVILCRSFAPGMKERERERDNSLPTMKCFADKEVYYAPRKLLTSHVRRRQLVNRVSRLLALTDARATRASELSMPDSS